jgi:uncharacterized protein YecE (DUF72 family)
MTDKRKGTFTIGTSGIVVPGTKQSFPPEYQSKSRLSYYSSFFNSLEVNSTFRKVPRVSTLQKWSADVPIDFQFTFKLWREITHVKQLNFDVENIDSFYTAVNEMSGKKGCLLIQFPGSITADYRSQVQKILLRLKQLDHENQWRKAVEFRNPTWYNSKTYKQLDKLGASIVLHDMPKSKCPQLNDAAQFAYFRYHGPKGDYRGDYNKEFLEEQAGIIGELIKDGRHVYAYFNNTMGNAFENATSLKRMVLE